MVLQNGDFLSRFAGNVKLVFQDNLEIDFSEKVSGIYFVNIFSKENCSTFKVVKL